MKKYKIKEYKFDDGRIWYKAFYKRLIFWRPLAYSWAIMNWTSWCLTIEKAKNLIEKDIEDHKKNKYRVSEIKYL